MKRVNELARDEAAMGTLVELTGAFEGIASMRISQLRVEEVFRFGRSDEDKEVENKELYIIITAEGGFSGDIDQKLVELMLQDFDKEKHDIIVIGHHGAVQLAQRGVSYKKYYKLPTKDRDINVTPIIRQVRGYKSTKIFYQEYVSLLIQDVRRIELSSAVNQRGKASDKPEDVISEATYIFEPSTYEVAAHLERSMMQIAISQLILESKLAQYASRFKAMSASHRRADEGKDDLHLAYNRAKRALKDDRLKEIVNGLKKANLGAGS
jgi:ATP synthase F1 gamma subunit